MKHLPTLAPLYAYEDQAAELLAAHGRGEAWALELLHSCLPRFLDDEVKWLPLPISNSEIRDSSLSMNDARMAVARAYSFRNWNALVEFVTQVHMDDSPVRLFELAVDAVIDGDVDTLTNMLRTTPGLVHARSTRETCHDPCVHGSTLLHYIAANGVEGYRQRSPANAVEVARILLDAGADVNTLAGLYGGECGVLSMLVSSSHPAEAGVQVPLVNLLADRGAELNKVGTEWNSPLMTALVFGFRDAAHVLVERGAKVDNIVAAAGLGDLPLCERLLPLSESTERHKALALGSLLGNLDVVRMLVDAGEDVNRYNPDGFHSHGTPLHHAAGGGYMDLVRLLVEHGADFTLTDTLWKATPAGWAEHEGQTEVLEYLRGLEQG